MSRTVFSVQVLLENHWVVETEVGTEDEAMKLANGLVNANQHEGVRVIREWHRGDGGVSDREIFSKLLTGKAKKITVSAIDQANPCSSPNDLFSLESRLTIGRLLRKLFDDMVLTPTELLHHYPIAKKFLDGDLLPAAVDRVATLQAAEVGVDSRTRRDQIYAMVDVLAAQAREAEAERALWKVKIDDVDTLIKTATSVGGVEKRDFLIRTALCRELVGIRSWIGKIDRLVQIVNDDTSPDMMVIMDGFIADVLAAPEATQELLGNHPNLAVALKALLGLVYGTKEGAGKNLPETTVILARLFAEGKLPSGTEVITDRVRRQIHGPAALSRNNPDEEDNLFIQIFASLLTEDGIIGGPPMAESLVMRFSRKFDVGTTDATRGAIFGLAELVQQRAQRSRFLLLVAESETGRSFGEEIGRHILEMANKAPDIHNFVHYRETPLRKLTIITSLMRRALASTAVPAAVVQDIVKRFDHMLVEYIDREKLVEKLDDPSHPFRARALRLVKFCGSGVLIEGEALEVMRQRVVELLRRPRFVEEFTQGMRDADEANRSVRDFRQLLVQSGFSA
ncbi:MAG: hypothetical protein H7840_00635 [Alphaproteobacteria bacterium]